MAQEVFHDPRAVWHRSLQFLLAQRPAERLEPLPLSSRPSRSDLSLHAPCPRKPVGTHTSAGHLLLPLRYHSLAMIAPMRRALDLARDAAPTSPNPTVGAVVLADGVIVGEGVTQPPPGDHAEVVALREAGDSASGATLYVTLEPCAHHGLTPPCTDAIITAGVAEVR